MYLIQTKVNGDWTTAGDTQVSSQAAEMKEQVRNTLGNRSSIFPIANGTEVRVHRIAAKVIHSH